MLKQDFNRQEPKRRNVADGRKQNLADAAFKDATYPTRLNFYTHPPTADIKLEEFEKWAIDRLRGVSLNFRLCNVSVYPLTALTNPLFSPRRARSLFVPQQVAVRNRHTHEALP